MWVGARAHLPLVCDLPPLVSHITVVDIENLSPTFFLSDFVHLSGLLDEFCEDECPGHTSWQDMVSLPSTSLVKEQLGKKEGARSIDIWGAVAVRGLGMGCEKSGLR